MSAAMDLRIEPARAALLLVDFQDRLAAVMPPDDRAAVERNILILLELARRLALPLVVSEQYPKGLGATVPALADAIASFGPGVLRFEKLEFGCADCAPFRDIHARLDRTQWIVVGMETHICVYQTVRGLCEWGASVHVPADAVISRNPANVRIGLGLIERAGGVVTTTETVVFDALKRAGSDDFKALSRLLR